MLWLLVPVDAPESPALKYKQACCPVRNEGSVVRAWFICAVPCSTGCACRRASCHTVQNSRFNMYVYVHTHCGPCKHSVCGYLLHTCYGSCWNCYIHVIVRLMCKCEHLHSCLGSAGVFVYINIVYRLPDSLNKPRSSSGRAVKLSWAYIS